MLEGFKNIQYLRITAIIGGSKIKVANAIVS